MPSTHRRRDSTRQLRRVGGVLSFSEGKELMFTLRVLLASGKDGTDSRLATVTTGHVNDALATSAECQVVLLFRAMSATLHLIVR